MIAALRYVDQVAGTSPMSDAITGRVEPEQLSSDEEYKSFVRERSGTEYHPAMSCSMLPRELGGVVDTSLKVYGTNNLRIADSSIIPIGISAHLQEPTYGIGEYAAAIISGNAQQKSDDDDHDEDNASSAGSSTVDNNANKAADDESSATTWSTFSAAGLISFTLLSWLL